MGCRNRRGEGGSMQEKDDRKKHGAGKGKNALKLLFSLSCCFLSLAEGVWRCYTYTAWPGELHHFVSANPR